MGFIDGLPCWRVKASWDHGPEVRLSSLGLPLNWNLPSESSFPRSVAVVRQQTEFGYSREVAILCSPSLGLQQGHFGPAEAMAAGVKSPPVLASLVTETVVSVLLVSMTRKALRQNLLSSR